MAIENVKIINPPIAGIVYFPAKKQTTKTTNKPYIVDNYVIV